jgi:hypothetical protein
MKLQRPVFIAATISVTLLLANVVNSTIAPDKFVSAYPAVVCAPTGSGLTSLVSVPSSKTKFRTVGVKTATFKKIKTSRYSQSGNPIIVDSKGVTPILWQARSGVWAGATICTAPISSQWFVGGASDVTSRGDLYLINSGLSSAIADIEVWNENSAVASKVVTVKPNSSISVGLDSLAPGSKNIVLHVIARTGRLNTFLVDERGKGLKALGGDLVNSADAPTKEIYIPAIPHQVTKTGKKNPNSTHYLRILVPGDTSSNVSVELSSAEGSFIPIGLQDRKLENGKVYSIALSPELSVKKFALHITSEQPVVAGVYSTANAKGKNDFVWSTAAPKLQKSTYAISGLSPTLLFTGAKISISAELTYSSGKSKIIGIDGAEFVNYQIPDKVRSISFTRVSPDTYGAALVSTKSGSGYFPLRPGSLLTRAAVPTSNIAVLTP